MIRIVFAALALAIAPVTASFAQEEAAPRYIENVNLDDMLKLAEGAGLTVIQSEDGAGPFVVVEHESGLRFVIGGGACFGIEGRTHCNGLALFAGWTETSIDDAGINALNSRLNGVKLFRSEELVYVRRYLVLDHGVAVENINENIGLFVGQAIKAGQEL